METLVLRSYPPHGILAVKAEVLAEKKGMDPGTSGQKNRCIPEYCAKMGDGKDHPFTPGPGEASGCVSRHHRRRTA